MKRFPHRIPRLHPLQLVIPPEVSRQFARQARQAFPQETLAYLLGYDLGTKLEITQLWVPGPDLMRATPSRIDLVDHTDWVAAQAALDEDPDLRILGDVHSHPFRRPEVQACQVAGLGKGMVFPSDADWDGIAGLRWITGICLVTEGPKGHLRTRFRWWGPLPKVEIIMVGGKA